MRPAQFYARVHPDGAAKIRNARQRAVDAGRGNLQPVGRRNRVLDVQRRRQRIVDRLAVVDGQRSVRPLGHDLDRRPLSGQDLDPHKAKIHRHEDRPRDGGDARGDAGLFDQARLIERRVKNLQVLVVRWCCFAQMVDPKKPGLGRQAGLKQKRAGPAWAPLPRGHLIGHDEVVD